MNKKAIFGIIGKLAMIEAALLLLPMAVSAGYKEWTALKAFSITALGAFVLGLLLTLICRSKNRVIYAKEGFAIVAASWLSAALIGAFPFVISKEIHNSEYFRQVNAHNARRNPRTGCRKACSENQGHGENSLYNLFLYDGSRNNNAYLRRNACI